jgi:hypothetical protein
MRLGKAFLAASSLLALISTPALAGDPNLLGVGIGLFDETFLDPRVGYFRIDYNRKHYEATDNRFEFMSGYNLLPTPEIYGRIHPTAGFEITSSAGTWLGGGIAYDVNYGPIHFTPKFEPGLFLPGDGKRLNYPLEFRTHFELSYEFADLSRLGVAISHLSNGELSRRVYNKTNPGSDIISIYYRFPLERWFPG